MPRQRIGAYAVALRGLDGRPQILLTQISALGYPEGWWGLPGGGVDHGESPEAAMRRELYEETGLLAKDAELIDVHDLHTVSPGRDDEFEDYHGIHLLYRVEVDTDAEPRVVETEGTTQTALWVDVDTAADIGPLLPVVEHVLAGLDAHH